MKESWSSVSNISPHQTWPRLTCHSSEIALHCQLTEKPRISGSQPLPHTGIFWETLKHTDDQVSHDSDLISLESHLGSEILFFKAPREILICSQVWKPLPQSPRAMVQPLFCLEQNETGQANARGKPLLLPTVVTRKQSPSDVSESSAFHESPPSLVSVFKIVLDGEKINFIVFTNEEDVVDFIHSFNIVLNVELRLQQTLMATHIYGA